jgi:hypothetical protein
MDFKKNLLELQSSASNYPFYEYPPKLSREKGTFAVSNNRSEFAMWKKPEKVEGNDRNASVFFIIIIIIGKKIADLSVWAAIDGRGRAW